MDRRMDGGSVVDGEEVLYNYGVCDAVSQLEVISSTPNCYTQQLKGPGFPQAMLLSANFEGIDGLQLPIRC